MKASRMIAGLLVPTMLTLSTAQAAKPVRWEDLPKKIGHGRMRSDDREDRQYRVLTKDGLTHLGHSIDFSATEVTLGNSSYPREQVTEIRIRSDGRWSDELFAPAGALIPDQCGGGGSWCMGFDPGILLLIPVLLGVTAVAAPIVLPIHGIKKLLPDKVIKVAP